MKYNLNYYSARPNILLEDDIHKFSIGLWTEIVDEDKILKRMKDIETEHKELVKNVHGFPQFVRFYPIEIIK